MKLSKIAVSLSGMVLSGLVLSNPSFAKGRLVIYCSAQNTMCEQEAMAFEKKFDVKTSFIRGGTGTILAKDFESILGKKAKVDISSDTHLTWDMIE